MKKSYTLSHGHIMRRATSDDILETSIVIFTVTAFKPKSGKYQSTMELAVEKVNTKDSNEKFMIYDDVLEALKQRDFYKDSIIVVNSTLYYPTILFSIKE